MARSTASLKESREGLGSCGGGARTDAVSVLEISHCHGRWGARGEVGVAGADRVWVSLPALLPDPHRLPRYSARCPWSLTDLASNPTSAPTCSMDVGE